METPDPEATAMDADVGPSTSNQAAPTEPHAMAAKGSTQGPQRVSGRVGVKGGGCAAAGGSRAAGLGGRGQASGGVQGRPGGQGSDGSGGSGSDTSSEEGGNGRLAPGEEDQLYDEGADDADSRWMEQQRAGRVSDAVLSCPGCFTTLCIDCQRHEKYHSQYRAMFVMNCDVDEQPYDPVVHGGGGAGAGGGRRPKRSKPSAQYMRVRCAVCTTEVGAYDAEDELYHFYHVFPSNA